MTLEDEAAIAGQSRLSQQLSLGFVLTLIPAFGIVAVMIGWRALREIEKSERRMVGRKMATWCIVVGSIEVLVAVLNIYYLTRSTP